MPVSNVQVGLLGGLVIIGLLGFQFLEIEKSEEHVNTLYTVVAY